MFPLLLCCLALYFYFLYFYASLPIALLINIWVPSIVSHSSHLLYLTLHPPYLFGLLCNLLCIKFHKRFESLLCYLLREIETKSADENPSLPFLPFIRTLSIQSFPRIECSLLLMHILSTHSRVNTWKTRILLMPSFPFLYF